MIFSTGIFAGCGNSIFRSVVPNATMDQDIGTIRRAATLIISLLLKPSAGTTIPTWLVGLRGHQTGSTKALGTNSINLVT
jgi:hypothetical protein